MSRETTKDLDGERPFEERVFARFDAIDEFLRSLDARVQILDSRVQSLDSRVESLDSRVQILESRAYDTKPIWDRALKEILETRSELGETRSELAGLATKLAAVETRMIAVEQEVGDLRRYIKREVANRLDQIQLVHLENRQDLRDFDKRIGT